VKRGAREKSRGHSNDPPLLRTGTRKKSTKKPSKYPPPQKKKKDLLASALDHATDVDARVKPIVSNLKGVKKALDRLGHAKSASTEEIQHWQQVLAAIDARRVDGVFAGDLKDVPAGQAQAVELLEACFERAHALLEGATDMDSHLRTEVFEPLVKHKRRTFFVLLIPPLPRGRK